MALGVVRGRVAVWAFLSGARRPQSPRVESAGAGEGAERHAAESRGARAILCKDGNGEFPVGE